MEKEDRSEEKIDEKIEDEKVAVKEEDKEEKKPLTKEELKKKKRKNLFLDIIFSVVILIGILIMLYPLVSQYYYRNKSSVDLNAYKDGVSKLSEEEIKERMLLARAYNEDLVLNQLEIEIEDPFAEEVKEEARAEYARMLQVHKLIGTLTVPKIAQELPVYAGTSEVVLQKGVGHMEGTSLPIGGVNTHTVVTAHRGLPNARLFTDLDKLGEGDRFYYTNIKETIAYQIYDIEVIEPDNFDALLIEEDKDLFTLLTCTPYMVNSHRLLVKGKRIPYNPELEMEDIRQGRNYRILIYLVFALIILLIILILLNLKKRRQYKLLKKEMEKMKKEMKDYRLAMVDAPPKEDLNEKKEEGQDEKKD